MSQAERLTEEQILQLLSSYRQHGSTDAREKLVLQYRNLVEAVARRFAGAGEPVEDLAQEGYIGLISALEGFDVSKGVKFSTYATHFVIGQIKHYLRDKGKIIKEPAWLQELNQRMAKVIESLSQEYGRQPTEAEISSVMKISEEEVSELLSTREVFKVSSLDGDREDPSGFPSDAEKAKKQKSESFQVPVEEKIVLETAVDRLKSIEQQVIHEYFFQDLNQTEIARKLGISCNYVSHILRNSTKKLRKILTTEDVRELQIRQQSIQRLGAAITAQTNDSIKDPATDIFTRPYFLARLEEELSRAMRHGYPVAAMLVKLVYLSDRKNAWIPMSIDERLYTLAQSIQEKIRKADIIARYDSNQFALLLPHTGSAGEKVCQRIGRIINDINDRESHDYLNIRATLTFACYPEQAGNLAEILDRLENGQPILSPSDVPEAESIFLASGDEFSEEAMAA